MLRATTSSRNNSLRRFGVDARFEASVLVDNLFDVEYAYPWGWDELEGIASRTDYDLSKHAQHSGKKLALYQGAFQ